MPTPKSSANKKNITFISFKLDGKSFMYKVKRVGHNIDPEASHAEQVWFLKKAR